LLRTTAYPPLPNQVRPPLSGDGAHSGRWTWSSAAKKSAVSARPWPVVHSVAQSTSAKDRNGHRPCAVRPASDAWCTVGAPRQQWRGRRDVLLSEKGMTTLWSRPNTNWQGRLHFFDLAARNMARENGHRGGTSTDIAVAPASGPHATDPHAPQHYRKGGEKLHRRILPDVSEVVEAAETSPADKPPAVTARPDVNEPRRRGPSGLWR
jgi:hypothetical protein